MYTLLGADGLPYRSTTPGTLGGHRRGRLYGRLDCPCALRAIARGHYAAHRVFFSDETTAITAGYRPCAVCLPATYARWKQNRESASAMDTIEERKQDRSPLIPASDLAAYGDLPLPSPHTEAELTALIGLLKYPGSRIETVPSATAATTRPGKRPKPSAPPGGPAAEWSWPCRTGPSRRLPGYALRRG
ncbi:hypothetical protein ACFUNF_10705 [Streptomyces sp. NPDC057291]|uniref:hypothetical protein n=1 Tax=Streptomyces sp. NPDC057291 TaxID=3346087 RepID=UPI00364359E1